MNVIDITDLWSAALWRHPNFYCENGKIDTVPTLIDITHVGIVRFAKIKDAKIILNAKSPTFRSAKLTVFAVSLMQEVEHTSQES